MIYFSFLISFKIIYITKITFQEIDKNCNLTVKDISKMILFYYKINDIYAFKTERKQVYYWVYLIKKEHPIKFIKFNITFKK